MILVDQFIRKSPNIKQLVLQDSEWEEVEAEDAETDQDILYSAGATVSGRVKNSYLESMAKTFDEVCRNEIYLFIYLDDVHLLHIYLKS